ncbi:competence type IV pilus major pilin ComGC, partial [Streptomyces scabiei]|uniref:competence type IV pilus major pilin ComGC n=1 Tax=Streptomyces scabiei TaxID=1930 RepID=UPI0038F67F09
MASKRAAFTLVEIMIVVLIIGILMAIAVPNFYQARTDSRTKACVSNLRLIETAKEQWALETKQSTGALPAQSDLYPTYMKTVPACPA